MIRPFMLLRRRFASMRWRTRVTLWVAATFAGLLVVMFARLADLALNEFALQTAERPWLPLIYTPLIGMLVVGLTNRFLPGCQGSGIPQVIAATRLARQGKPVSQLVSLKIAFAKIGLGTLALTGGFSAGREGPSVQVAASVMHFFHRYLPNARIIRSEDLILAGGAAGIAAAFNTPLAGIAFAVEELGRRLETRTSGVLLSTIILSGMVAIALQGNYNYFGHFDVQAISMDIILPALLIAIGCGLLGGLFSRMLLWPQRYRNALLWRWRRQHPVWFAGICGLIVAVLGVLSGGMSFGSGYGVTSHVIASDIGLPWHAALTRFIATVVTYFSGIPGGIFAPCLAVGAAIGANISDLFNLGVQPVIALCMVGFLAAVTQSPITSAIIVMEMIDSHGMVISLMGVALVAKAVSSRMGPELYQQMARGFVQTAERTSAKQKTGQ
ncbi:chloride channel protein [Pseudomonas corrugata]|uniref:Chloride channel protein n=2 Tax=Pseudomonas corrugata TaxID=47879 RepID=A0A8B6UXA4_9PSED|nr:chloride channel protein [Pseudomonas corrugata]AOE65154.1 chloride channel protein [Pseudomonas corrugata]MDU9026011.1 chloride channel protein [Pseudomonas corrugata]MDU9036263.1 chloride channel protein [Pseudomonas corrugata]MDU9040518.1 chloride channel protein [Pseudomonas corrugata]QTH16531.1 chloride channel protein [Pseudomonas corrugata]